MLLFVLGVGFGCMPPLAATALQNNVSIHTFGSAVATMQFSRNLFATMLVAVFGVLVLAGGDHAAGAKRRSIRSTASSACSWRSAASFAISLAAMILLDEKPLETRRT